MTGPARPWILVWDHFGPYHYARIDALIKESAVAIIPVQIACNNVTYNWDGNTLLKDAVEVIALQKELPAERLGFLSAMKFAFKLFLEKRPAVVFCPSYWPMRSLAIVLAARFAGARTVMMNESHAGTEKTGFYGRIIKRALLKLFDAALVGGAPH